MILNVDLTESEALAFSQFLKRSLFSTYKSCAVDEDETYTMIAACEKLREAFANNGYAPR